MDAAAQLLVRSFDTPLPVSSVTAISQSFVLPTGRGNCNKIGVILGTDSPQDAAKISVTVKINGVEVIQSCNGLLFLRNNFTQKSMFRVTEFGEQSTLDISYLITGTLSATLTSTLLTFYDK